MLSRAGKEILIKAVAQSIPTYNMGVFLLPVRLCNDMNAMCARFWLGQIGNERKIHCKSWNALTLSKKEGGMGFHDLRSFNLAMLAKQGWRLLQEEDLLVNGCFKAKYFPRSSFLEASDVPNSSFVWKSLLAAQPLLKKGSCWRVGNGNSIRIMHEKWIPNHPSNQVLQLPPEMDGERRVSELIDETRHKWDRVLIREMFSREEAEAIIRIPLSKRDVPDFVVWLPNKDGVY